MATKTIQFDKFKPYYLASDELGNKVENILDLSALFRDVSAPEFSPALQQIWGDFYRFHKCRYDESLRIWELQILHLREKILPGMAGRESGYDIISLPEGKYAAESSTLLYDPQDSTLYMQRNVFCMSPKKLAVYFARLLPENTHIVLKVVQAHKKIQSMTEEKKYRKIVLVANTKESHDLPEGSSLAALLQSYGRYNGTIAHIEISMGRRRGMLNSKAAVELISEAYESDAIEQLKVSMSDPDDVGPTLVDLMEDRDSYRVVLEYSRDNPITHQRLFEKCKECYCQEKNK